MNLKIAITSPFGWPYVRRGNRFVHELAAYLAEKGNEVHLITSKPGIVNRSRIRGKVLEKHRSLCPHPLVSILHIDMWEIFFWGCLRSLMAAKYDIVHTFWQPDGFAASVYRSLRGTPYVHLLVESNHFYCPTKYGKPMLKRILSKASCLQVPSIFMREELKKEYNAIGELIPMAVNLKQFIPKNEAKLYPPRILCTSSFLEARKRVYMLVLAFEILLKKVPTAILQLSGHGGKHAEATRGLLNMVTPATRRSIEILDVGKLEDMPKLYRQAALTALPSIQESFGMVIIESLASGTPVVATRSGAIPEILNSRDVGVMVEATDGPEVLSDALKEGLELAKREKTVRRCSEHVGEYSWEMVGPRYESLYMKVLQMD